MGLGEFILYLIKGFKNVAYFIKNDYLINFL